MGRPATKRRLRALSQGRYSRKSWHAVKAHHRNMYHRDFGSMRECHERLMRESDPERRAFERDIIRYYLVACREDRSGRHFPKLP